MSKVQLLEICIFPPEYAKLQCADDLLLDNIGNTCYINVILQLLFHNEEFRAYVCSYKGDYKNNAPKHNLLLLLKRIFTVGKLGYTSETLDDFLNIFRDLRIRLVNNVPSDAMEVMSTIFQTIPQQVKDFWDVSHTIQNKYTLKDSSTKKKLKEDFQLEKGYTKDYILKNNIITKNEILGNEDHIQLSLPEKNMTMQDIFMHNNADMDFDFEISTIDKTKRIPTRLQKTDKYVSNKNYVVIATNRKKTMDTFTVKNGIPQLISAGEKIETRILRPMTEKIQFETYTYEPVGIITNPDEFHYVYYKKIRNSWWKYSDDSKSQYHTFDTNP